MFVIVADLPGQPAALVVADPSSGNAWYEYRAGFYEDKWRKFPTREAAEAFLNPDNWCGMTFARDWFRVEEYQKR